MTNGQRERPATSAGRVRALSALALLALACACAASGRASMRANERAKAGSVAEWKERVVGAESAESYLGARTAMVLGGADALKMIENPDGTRAGQPMRDGAPARDATGGAAVAIDERGYWLTAAHVVDREPLLVVTVRDRVVSARPARVVWTDDETHMDLALVHTDGRLPATLPWPASAPWKGRVLCCGSGIGSDRFAAGAITSVSGSTGDNTFTVIEHDAPLSAGDSGGPAMTEDGAFAGVNFETAARSFGRGVPSSTAILPDAAFVRALIERDVREHARARP